LGWYGSCEMRKPGKKRDMQIKKKKRKNNKGYADRWGGVCRQKLIGVYKQNTAKKKIPKKGGVCFNSPGKQHKKNTKKHPSAGTSHSRRHDEKREEWNIWGLSPL